MKRSPAATIISTVLTAPRSFDARHSSPLDGQPLA